MNVPHADWFIIRTMLKGWCDTQRQDDTNQSTNLMEPSKIENFIEEVDKDLNFSGV